MLRYDPPVGTFLMVGVHDLKVTCTPDDKSFSAVSSTTQIQVLFPKLIDVSTAKSTPEVSWRSSKNFVAPYFFDEKSIKASCSVPSRITYDIQLGTKFGPGRQTIKAVCIPLDTPNWNSVESRFEFEVMTPTLRNSSLFKLNSSALDSSEKKLLLPLRQQTGNYAKFECIAYLNSEMIEVSREVLLAKKRAKSVCDYVLKSKSIKYSISVASIKGAQKATQRNLLKPFRVDIIMSN